MNADALMNTMRVVPGSEFSIPATLVLLAMGFVHPVRDGLIADLRIELDPRGNVRADTRKFAASEPGVFAAGDCRRGQSLVVWAQWEGREAARSLTGFDETRYDRVGDWGVPFRTSNLRHERARPRVAEKLSASGPTQRRPAMQRSDRRRRPTTGIVWSVR